jgi:hypothetical protein
VYEEYPKSLGNILKSFFLTFNRSALKFEVEKFDLKMGEMLLFFISSAFKINIRQLANSPFISIIDVTSQD